MNTLDTIGTPALWAAVIGLVVVLLAVDFLLTRRPHEVSMKEALGWSAFYVALPLAFGAYVFAEFGSERGVEYLTGYLVEKSLSVDNLFVFLLLMGAFAVPGSCSSACCSTGSSAPSSCAASSSPSGRPPWARSTGCSWSSAWSWSPRR